MKKQKSRGFTLIELLVVIAIIAVLMGILMLILLFSERQKQHRRSNFSVQRVSLAVFIVLGTALVMHGLVVPSTTVLLTRNFYGVLRIQAYKEPKSKRKYLKLVHGRIAHGMQYDDAKHRRQPTSYYGEESGVGLALRHLPRKTGRRIGVVGLGVGTLAAYGREGDVIRFYEIDPQVFRFAEKLFSYLKDSEADVEVVPGDARLSLEREASQNSDLLVLDAFSGGAVPVHLLTKEAFEVYLRHLNPDGVLAVHITNIHLDLAPVVRRLGEAFHLEAISIMHRPDTPE
ncbi:MAG: fused MFS/spermidine synthase, partial [Planctomycetes bacterium]|nr:fused MFS/spermidine synthase [Planctomycetota bacterium]